MTAPGTLLEPIPLQDQSPTSPWSLPARVAFRFCFVYFGLYCLGTQILAGLIPFTDLEVPDPSTKWPVRQVVTWVAVHLFHVKTELVYFSGSGDKTFDWVFAFCLLIFSIVVTGVWTAIDRQRNEYSTLHKWFHVFLRLCLAGQLLAYGIDKAVPLQMPFPYLSRLVEPFGNFSPMGVLWSSIGAAPAYEIFAGCAEVLAGILLIFPRTAMLGALICLADMVQVFMLNMAYDVPVKLFSFHLILMSLFLLAPDLRRLVNFFFLDRPASSSTQPNLFADSRRNRLAVTVQIVFGLLLLGANIYGARSAWYQYGGGKIRSALYGIWNITDYTVEGQNRPPLMSDNDRWRRAIFELPARMSFQRMDDSLARYNTLIKVKENTIIFTKDDDKNWKADFAFQRPSPDRLILDGTMDNHKIHMQLDLIDVHKFPLLTRGFHGIQEYPFNR